ncbi:MAG TPA: hypothetical protein ENK43_13680 [Planctomycetes bacterium]|nr:hypothetical protein [Planctomycetota bacterium]
MRITRTLVFLALAMLPALTTSCATSTTTVTGMTKIADDAYAADEQITGDLGAAVDAPFNAVGAVWNEPQTEFPFYLTSIVDPYNYPHMLWRAFYTVWTVPVNPLYHVTKGPVEDWDSNISPIGETISYDFNPAPHGGDSLGYFTSRWESTRKHFRNIGETLKYHFLNTNSAFPPYDRFYPEVWQSDKTLLHRTFDIHLFRYDWDDPYID